MAEASALFQYFGYTQDQFRGKVILDVGAGSQLLTKFFREAHLIAIEPLARKFLAQLPWSDLLDAEEVYSLPAEQRILELRGRVDFAISINVLDHCLDPAMVVRNIYYYLRDGGEACISVDCHQTRDPVHPQALAEGSVSELLRDAGFVVRKVVHGLEGVYADGRNGYGSVGEAVTFFVVKQAPRTSLFELTAQFEARD